MFDFLNKGTFPWWYSLLKWGIPLGLAILTGVGTGLLLTSTIGMPAFFGMLKWAPAFYATLEGFSAVAVLGLASTAVASTVGFLSSFLLRGSVLFPISEVIASNAQRNNAELENTHKQQQKALEQRLQDQTDAHDKRCEEYETALQDLDTRLSTMTNQYHQLRGRSSNKHVVDESAKPKNDAANDGKPANKRGRKIS